MLLIPQVHAPVATIKGYLTGYDSKALTCKFVRWGDDSVQFPVAVKNDRHQRAMASDSFRPAVWHQFPKAQHGTVYASTDACGSKLYYDSNPLGLTPPNLQEYKKSTNEPKPETASLPPTKPSNPEDQIFDLFTDYDAWSSSNSV